jgi:hypothetical protein
VGAGLSFDAVGWSNFSCVPPPFGAGAAAWPTAFDPATSGLLARLPTRFQGLNLVCAYAKGIVYCEYSTIGAFSALDGGTFL